MEGSGRGIIQDTIPTLAWSDWEKQRKTSVGVTGLRGEIWNLDLPNTKQECQQLGSDVRPYGELRCWLFRLMALSLQSSLPCVFTDTDFRYKFACSSVPFEKFLIHENWFPIVYILHTWFLVLNDFYSSVYLSSSCVSFSDLKITTNLRRTTTANVLCITSPYFGKS
jgi:hypothetical protein